MSQSAHQYTEDLELINIYNSINTVVTNPTHSVSTGELSSRLRNLKDPIQKIKSENSLESNRSIDRIKLSFFIEHAQRLETRKIARSPLFTSNVVATRTEPTTFVEVSKKERRAARATLDESPVLPSLSSKNSSSALSYNSMSEDDLQELFSHNTQGPLSASQMKRLSRATLFTSPVIRPETASIADFTECEFDTDSEYTIGATPSF